jgi:hypothetical protein
VNEQRLSDAIKKHLTPEQLRGLFDTDERPNWDWICAHLADWLAQELAPNLCDAPAEPEEIRL